MPVDSISVTFLGTAAGRPSASRNVSSLVVRLDARLWMVDCGEGTQHRLMNHSAKHLAMSKIARIFITHMHADHVNGLPGLLATISAGDGIPSPGTSTEPPPIEIYGPSGLRKFLRCTLSLTQTTLSRPYRVHQLLFRDEQADVFDTDLHPNEQRGQDLTADSHGFWRDLVAEDDITVSAGPILHTIRCVGYFFSEAPRSFPIQPQQYIPHLQKPINRAALLASHPELKNPLSLLSRFQADPDAKVELADGTVLRAPGLDLENGGRRFVILGDTYDASGLVPLIRSGDPSLDQTRSVDDDPLRVDLVVHESTNAYLPTLDDSQSPSRRTGAAVATLESVTALARSHGHSTPQVAGSFARSVRADQLVLNHLSVKYPDPDAEHGTEESRDKWRRMLREIERQASRALEGVQETEADLQLAVGTTDEQTKVVTARDFMEIELPRRDKLARVRRRGAAP